MRPSRKVRVLIQQVAIFGGGVWMVLCFQNFTPIPLDRLKPDMASAHSASPTDGHADIRDLAPYRAQSESAVYIATPGSGSNLDSLSQDWLTREAHLVTGGADERYLVALNKRLNRWFNPDEDDVVQDPITGNSQIRAPASTMGALASLEQETFFTSLRPKSLRVMSANRVRMDFANNTQVSCSFRGDSIEWDLTHPVNDRFDINLNHQPSRAKSLLSINYRW